MRVLRTYRIFGGSGIREKFRGSRTRPPVGIVGRCEVRRCGVFAIGIGPACPAAATISAAGRGAARPYFMPSAIAAVSIVLVCACHFRRCRRRRGCGGFVSLELLRPLPGASGVVSFGFCFVFGVGSGGFVGVVSRLVRVTVVSIGVWSASGVGP